MEQFTQKQINSYLANIKPEFISTTNGSFSELLGGTKGPLSFYDGMIYYQFGRGYNELFHTSLILLIEVDDTGILTATTLNSVYKWQTNGKPITIEPVDAQSRKDEILKFRSSREEF